MNADNFKYHYDMYRWEYPLFIVETVGRYMVDVQEWEIEIESIININK